MLHFYVNSIESFIIIFVYYSDLNGCSLIWQSLKNELNEEDHEGDRPLKASDAGILKSRVKGCYKHAQRGQEANQDWLNSQTIM